MKQFRIVYSSGRGGGHGACFVDAATEQGAREFFKQSFPGAIVVEVKLEPVDPCNAYERRPVPA